MSLESPWRGDFFFYLFLSRWNVHVCLCYWERDKEKELMSQQVCGRLLWISGRFDDNLTEAERTWKQILWCWLSTKDFCHIQIAVYPLLSVPLLVTISPFLSFLHLFLKYLLDFLFCFALFFPLCTPLLGEQIPTRSFLRCKINKNWQLKLTPAPQAWHNEWWNNSLLILVDQTWWVKVKRWFRQ